MASTDVRYGFISYACNGWVMVGQIIVTGSFRSLGKRNDVSCSTRNNELKPFHQWDGDDLLLELYIQPNAKKDELIGEYGDKLKIRITAPPVDNKANKHLLKFLAIIFAVPPSRIELIKGENQRAKRVKILNPIKLPKMIEAPTCGKTK